MTIQVATGKLAALHQKLMVSCQAPEGNPFRDADSMARFARAAVAGGAAGIRTNGCEDVQAIRQAVDVPIIGIEKVMQADGRLLITPTMEAAQALVQAGADLIALDCTRRGQSFGALERLRQIKEKLNVPVLADIATVEEAVQAAAAGADAVLSTMRGYTDETREVGAFEPRFIADLVRAVKAPVIAEGRIWTPEQARAALEVGAHAVIVGTAITRPDTITQRFVAAMGAWRRNDPATVLLGIDMGGTRTKFGLVSGSGEMLFGDSAPTPWKEGRDALLSHLAATVRAAWTHAARLGVAPRAIGLATAGWVDPGSGEVVFATGNLPGWTGANPVAALRKEFGVPVAIENDANALAVAEKYFGAAKTETDFACITLGTGVGGGCYVGGRLNRGGHCFANAIGHIPIVPEGLPCTCGLVGCLECYANAAALLRYASEGGFASSEQVIAAANRGDAIAQRAIDTLGQYLAIGCASLVHLLDPDLIVLAGGLAQNNPLLLSAVASHLGPRVTAWRQRDLRIVASPLGYSAGVVGAAALAAASLGGQDAVRP